MKTTVVVGANGFLGNALVNELIRQDYAVTAVYHTRHDNINPTAKLMTNEELLASDLEPDLIFYLPGNYATPHAALLEINNTLYRYSLRFAHAKMVYASSVNVYGSPTAVVTETSAFNNPGLYAQSKLAGEFIVTAMAHYAVLRLAYIYGPGITNKSFIPAIIASAREHKKINLFGQGEREQDYLYIDDAVSLCIAAGLREINDTYLGATGISVSNKTVAEEIQKHIDCDIVFTGQENGQSFYFDPQQTFHKLAWKPRVSIAKGIENMVT